MDRTELRTIAEEIKEDALRTNFSGQVWHPLRRDILWSEHGYLASDGGVELSNMVDYPVSYEQIRELSIDEIESLVADRYNEALRKMAAKIEDARPKRFEPKIVD